VRGAHLAILVLALGAWSAVLVAALAAGGAAPAWLEGAAGFLGSCPHRTLTGESCPLCGTTTAARLLLGGEPAASLAANPLALGLIAAGITQPIYRLARTLRPAFAWREELVVDGIGLGWLAGAIALVA
jgi:hypothetical protein